MPHHNRRVGSAFGFLSLAFVGSAALAGACGTLHTPLGWDDAGADEDAKGGAGGGGAGTGGAGAGTGGHATGTGGHVTGTGGHATGTGGASVGTGGASMGTGGAAAGTGGAGGRNAGTGGRVGTGGSPGSGGTGTGTGGKLAGTGGTIGGTCGGLLGTPCPPDSICDLPAGLCGGADISGTCTKLPSACSKILQPVCGCDGVTYSNDCERLVANAQLDHTGTCDSAGGGEGASCGGFRPGPTLDCASGLFCELPSGSCLIADVGGTCRTVSQVCTQIFSPVCGCDGVTYSNDCERRAASAQLDHTGACDVPPKM